MLRSKNQNRAIRINCPKHPNKYGQRTYDTFNNKGKRDGIICIECGRPLKVYVPNHTTRDIHQSIPRL